MTGVPRRERPPVRGAVVDDMTRCVHYRSAVDIVAIRFACCGEYYPCHLCHEEAAGHPAEQRPLGQRETKAVLCGACGEQLTISEYLGAIGCPYCESPFNEGCALHAHLYFELADGERGQRAAHPGRLVGGRHAVRSASAAASSAAPFRAK